MVEKAILERYRDLYQMRKLPPAELVLAHWNLERRLRDRLMNSEAATRSEVAEAAYTELYEQLSWHNDLSTTIAGSDNVASWLNAIPANVKRIYEVGSGQGRLLREIALAYPDADCCGTEITSERGKKFSRDETGVRWAATDGVHLDEYEDADSYDVVISNQVVEHLHPEDLNAHFVSVGKILKPGGIYLVSTPHRVTGPHDVSRAFNTEEAEGLHLKEYSWRELREVARHAGFEKIESGTLRRFGNPGTQVGRVFRHGGRAYLFLMVALESLLGGLPSHALRAKTGRLLKKVKLFSDNIYLICHWPR